MGRETVGKISLDLLKNAQDDTHSAYEQMCEQLSEYDANILECINQAKRYWVQQDFYIVVITKRERLTPNVFRHYFLSRTSCPTPDYDQAVYFYDNGQERLDFLWIVPDRITTYQFARNPELVHPEDMTLLKFVLDFKDGTLFTMAKYRNNEIIA